jgi:hypothetical protein
MVASTSLGSNRHKVYQDNRFREVVSELLGHGQGQASLAHPRWSSQGDQALILRAQEPAYHSQVPPASDEGRQRLDKRSGAGGQPRGKAPWSLRGRAVAHNGRRQCRRIVGVKFKRLAEQAHRISMGRAPLAPLEGADASRAEPGPFGPLAGGRRRAETLE